MLRRSMFIEMISSSNPELSCTNEVTQGRAFPW